jgi:hypothetical protein
MEVDVSPHNRMSHKFHVGQLVVFRPLKGSAISQARRQIVRKDVHTQAEIAEMLGVSKQTISDDARSR